MFIPKNERLKMNLQLFADPDKEDDDVFEDVEDVILEGDPVDGDEPIEEPKKKQGPPPLSLDTHAWKNVLDLMETQQKKLDQNLSGLTPSLTRMDELAAQTNNTLAKLNETMGLFLEAITPKEMPVDSPITPEPEPEKKKGGLSWKKKK